MIDEEVLAWSMKYFDKDGFEINELEQAYYRDNDIFIDGMHLFHIANQTDWIMDWENSDFGCVVDHSMISTRWAFGGPAREQLIALSYRKPELNKLLAIRPKWGIDISIDYTSPTMVFEVFHFEWDDFDYETVAAKQEKIEKIVLNTDWNDAAEQLIKRKDEWHHLDFFAQSKWKSDFFGVEPEQFKMVAWD